MKTFKRYPPRWANKPGDDNGDFDDLGKAKTAGQYHYQQKKERGKL